MQGMWRFAGALAVAGALTVTLGAREAAAQDRFNPRVGLVTTGPFYRFTLAARMNPIGLFADLRGGYRLRLFNNPTRSVLLRNTYVALLGSVVASPAFVRPGVALEIAPLAILNLQVGLERVQWFGSFKALQTTPSAAVGCIGAAGVFSSGCGSADTTSQTAQGWQMYVQGILQARIGQSLAVRNTFRAVRSWYDTTNLPTGHRVYYDPFFDIHAPLDGWVLANDLDVLASLTDLGTNIGLRYSAVLPQLNQDEAGSPDRVLATHRLGPIITYTFREQRHSALNAPTIFFLAQWWLRHPFRTDAFDAGYSHQAMPMIILGFSMRGDW